ncbi:MAG TPA: hypothetical protein VGK23_01800 [Methanomassiliicoccales archaeon]|jgi:hypothetical protein
MPRESKIIRFFRILADKYDAKVQYDPMAPQRSASDLIVTLTVYGQRMTFISKSNEFQSFCNARALEELGEKFTKANMNALFLQLETIATSDRAIRNDVSCCGCGDLTPELDDE